MSCAKIGSSAVADEKNVAKKSSSIVERMSGERNTNCSPSSAARSETSASDPGRGRRALRQRRASSAARRSRRRTKSRSRRYDPADARRGDEEPAERRADDRGGLKHDRVQADGVRQVLARHERRHQRAAAPAGRTRRRPRRAPPARRSATRRVRPRNASTASASATSVAAICVEQHQPAAVPGVGDDAADHREDDDRHDADEADQPEREALAVPAARAATRATGAPRSASSTR